MTTATEEVWHLAVCLNCTKVLPQPFSDPAARDNWTAAHRAATGHDVRRLTEVRAK